MDSKKQASERGTWCTQCDGTGRVVDSALRDQRCPRCGATISRGKLTISVQGSDASEVERVTRGLLAEAAPTTTRPGPWSTGLFYLLCAVVLLVGSRIVSPVVLPAVVVGSAVLLAVVGAFQLRHDDRLREKNFLGLMALSLRLLPWVHRGTRRRARSEGEPTEKNSNV